MPGGNCCTEIWKLSNTSIACVQMGGVLTRKFDTGDAAQDFPLDFVTYQMHAKFGQDTDTDNVFRFDEIAVNMADFLAAETNFGYVGAAAGVSVIAGLMSMLA